MTKPEANRLSCVVAFRTTKASRELLKEEAMARKETLADFVFELVLSGWNALQAQKAEEKKKAEAEVKST